ncbi:MAG: FtsW/RodA/SpoVE family cell cycle protein [bacterium]|nr:FtsW/RodA/SpoVE family cell cycle protein [bacterium]
MTTPPRAHRLLLALRIALAVVLGAVALYFLYWGWRVVRALFLPQNLQLTLHVVEVVLLCLLALDLLIRFRRGFRPRLVLRTADGFEINVRRSLVVGSSPGPYGLTLSGPQVSRRHLEIRRTHNRELEATDLESTNGTFLRGEDLRSSGTAVLGPGDRLELGRGGPGLECAATPPAGLLSHGAQLLAWLGLLWCGLLLGWQANVERLPAQPIPIGRVTVAFAGFRSFLPALWVGLAASLAGFFWFRGRQRHASWATAEAGTALQILLVLGLVVLYPLLPSVGLRYAQAAQRALVQVGVEHWEALEDWERSGGDPRRAAAALTAGRSESDPATAELPELELEPEALRDTVRRYAQGRSSLRWATNLAARADQPLVEVIYFRQAFALIAAVLAGISLPLWFPKVRAFAGLCLRGLTRPFSQRLIRAADHGRRLARILRPIAYWDVLCGFVAAAVVAVTLWTPLGTTLGRGKSLYLDLPGIPTIQSVELVKALFVLFMTGFFARQGELLAKVPRRRYLVPYFLAVLCTLALTGVQADMGALFMLGLFLGLVFVAATGNLRLVLLVPLLLLPGVALAYLLGLMSIVATRLGIWFDPRLHPLGEQIVQARQLLLSSGWSGFTPQRLLAWHVPDVQADLIIAAFGERFGLIGLVALIACWFVLIASLLRGARRAERSGSILLASVGALVLIQILTQAGGAMGLLPLTGVPIPWLSHGLTASLIFTALVALALAVTSGDRGRESPGPGPTDHLRYLGWANAGACLALVVLACAWTVLLPRREDVGPGGRLYRWQNAARTATIERWIEAGLFAPIGRSTRARVDHAAYREYVEAAHSDPGLLELISVAEGLRVTEEGLRPLPYVISHPNRFAERINPRGWLTGREGVALAMTDARGRRNYPLGPAGFHPVGYAGGLARPTGIEAPAGAFLSAIDLEWPLRLRAFVDDIHHGPDVMLTLDAGLQRAAYEELADRAGAVVVMDLDDGALLALASSPAVDPNGTTLADWQRFARRPERLLLNRAIRSTDGYSPPGSVFKIVVAAATLLSHGDFDPNAEIRCRGTDPELRVSCAHGRVHGRIDLRRALTVSCNIYFARAVVALGADEVRQVAERFGFNPGETANLLRGVPGATLPLAVSTVLDPPGTALTPTALARVGYGQGPVSATPLQVARMGGVIATGGELIEPYLARAIGLAKYRDGIRRVLWDREVAEPKRRRAVPRLVAEQLNQVLVEVFDGDGGTARNLDKLWHGPVGWRLAPSSPGDGWERVAVAGKTGSAWKTRADRTDDAWMVAWAPADEPRLVVSVLVEDAGEGGKVAGPIAMRMLRDALEAIDDES